MQLSTIASARQAVVLLSLIPIQRQGFVYLTALAMKTTAGAGKRNEDISSIRGQQRSVYIDRFMCL